VIQNKERYDKKFGGSLQNFKIVEEIGRGAFGVVFKVQNSLIPNKFFVLKKIPLTNV
jgi:serine/threonine protein kinase